VVEMAGEFLLLQSGRELPNRIGLGTSSDASQVNIEYPAHSSSTEDSSSLLDENNTLIRKEKGKPP
jgi:hypothetical protein